MNISILLVTILQIFVPGVLACGCFRWWRRTKHWSFLVLSICGALYFTLGAWTTIATNVLDFGKTPEVVARHQHLRAKEQINLRFYFHTGILAACAVAGLGLMQSATRRDLVNESL